MSKFRSLDEAAQYYYERIDEGSQKSSSSSIEGESETLSIQVMTPLRETGEVLSHICEVFPDESNRSNLLSASLKRATNAMNTYLEQIQMSRSVVEKVSDLSLSYESRLLLPNEPESTRFIAEKVRNDVEQIIRMYRSAGTLVPDDVMRSREDLQNAGHVLAGMTLLKDPSALEDPGALESASILHKGILKGEKVETMVSPQFRSLEEKLEQLASALNVTLEEVREEFVSAAREQIIHFHSLYLRHRILRTLILSVDDVSDVEGG